MTDGTYLREGHRSVDPPVLNEHGAWSPGYSLKVGDKIMMNWPRSRWAILWDRIRHPFTEPTRTEKRYAEVTSTTDMVCPTCGGPPNTSCKGPFHLGETLPGKEG